MSSSLSDSVNGAHPTATPPASPRPSPEGALVFCSVPPHVDSEDPESPSQPSLGPTLQNRGHRMGGEGQLGTRPLRGLRSLTRGEVQADAADGPGPAGD